MNLAQRFAYYGVGFVIGIIILFFFLGGKKTGCDYGPDARVLKNIRIKKRAFSDNTLSSLHSFQLDTGAVSSLLRSGDVDFGESNRDLDSCKLYTIKGKVNFNGYKMLVENCDSTATVVSFKANK